MFSGNVGKKTALTNRQFIRRRPLRQQQLNQQRKRSQLTPRPEAAVAGYSEIPAQPTTIRAAPAAAFSATPEAEPTPPQGEAAFSATPEADPAQEAADYSEIREAATTTLLEEAVFSVEETPVTTTTMAEAATTRTWPRKGFTPVQGSTRTAWTTTFRAGPTSAARITGNPTSQILSLG